MIAAAKFQMIPMRFVFNSTRLVYIRENVVTSTCRKSPPRARIGTVSSRRESVLQKRKRNLALERVLVLDVLLPDTTQPAVQ